MSAIGVPEVTSATPEAAFRILLVEDDADVRDMVGQSLVAAGHHVTVASDGAAGVEAFTTGRFDLVITDVQLPKVDGLTLFRRVRADSPDTHVILMTSFGSVSDAVTALKQGARDYLTKPFDLEELVIRVAQIGKTRALERELAEARKRLVGGISSRILGDSPPMRRLLDRLATVAQSDAPILVTGESGTGKELVAREIHDQSARRNGPFIAINCAAFPESLLEAELFGHEKGAFTGAARRRDGRFKVAHGGTLFLDELAEMPLPAQAKLLRVVQEGAIEPLGTHESIRVDVRLVSATHRDLKKRIAEGLFREDLYYRLNVVALALPPLRERRADMPLLLQAFLKRFAKPGDNVDISAPAWAALMAYPFPGNVREFQHAVQHAVVLARGRTIELEHLPDDIAGTAKRAPERGEGKSRPLAALLKECERHALLDALAAADGKRVLAAQILGISRKNLWEKLRAQGISDSDLEDE